MSFSCKFFIFLVIHNFTGFASTINTEFEIIFFNAFLTKASLSWNAQFTKTFCLFLNMS